LLPALRGSLGHYDVWVDSGDFQGEPARIGADRGAILRWQRARWLHTRLADNIRAALAGRPAVLVPGNHDAYDYRPHLRRPPGAALAGNILAPANGEVVEAAGLRWCGLRSIPACGGYFEGEMPPVELAEMARNLPAADVLVSHAPPAGPASRLPEWGVPGLEAHPAWVVLCGHIHERGGMDEVVEGRRIVNGARRARIIRVEM
jgi:Icc-related predicted phosphoesterase